MASSDVRHPLFARLFTLLSRNEPRELRAHRQRLLAGLSGRVVEVGAGAGANFRHYPGTVSEVVAVEPEPYMRSKAEEAAATAAVSANVVDGTADRLPLADGSCNAAVVCLVLCSVPDQRIALAEVRRVLKPGGQLRFYEHVLSHTERLARTQRFVDRTFWPRAFGGCHTARDTPTAIAAAGFDIDQEERLWVAPVRLAAPVATHVLGSATRR